MATYNGIKKIKIGDNIFNLAVDWSNVTNPPTIPTNTDENVKSTAHTTATTYYLTGSTSSDTTTGGLNKHASASIYTVANSSTDGSARLTLGNTTASGTAGAKYGYIRLYGSSTYYIDIKVGSPTGNKTITFPDKTGTVALTSDIPSYTDTNTTYALSGALSSHKFTSTLTAGGSGSGTSTSDFTLAAGTGITITDDTSNRKMTIACSVTNTDTKVSTALAVNLQTYYPVLGTDTTSASTKNYDKGFMYLTESGTTSDIGEAGLALGNSTASGTAGNKKGMLTLFGSSAYGVTLESGAPTTTRTITFPDDSGTVILDTDVLDISTITPTNNNISKGRLITGAQYCNIPRFIGYTNFYDVRIASPSTNVTATLPLQGMGRTQIIDIISWDATTGEKVIVDWLPSTRNIATGNMTITISIAKNYSHTICCLILYRQMFGM